MNGAGRRPLPLIVLIVAIATAAFGIAFMLAPTQVWNLYGLKLDREGEFVARMFGTANVGAGLLLCWARSALAVAPTGVACWWRSASGAPPAGRPPQRR